MEMTDFVGGLEFAYRETGFFVEYSSLQPTETVVKTQFRCVSERL